MKFISTRELRNRPGWVRELTREDEVIVTANGKPIALLLGIDEGDLEETALAVRQAKAQRALSRMRRDAAIRGLDQMSAVQIDAEIRAAREKRRRR